MTGLLMARVTVAENINTEHQTEQVIHNHTERIGVKLVIFNYIRTK